MSIDVASSCQFWFPVENPDDDSSEHEIRTTNSNPYPYENIYIDIHDKRRIQALSELEREAILGERQDELQKVRDRENIKHMVRARDEESSKRTSGREKNRPGLTNEKAQKLDELKLKRQEKSKRPKVRTHIISFNNESSVADLIFFSTARGSRS